MSESSLPTFPPTPCLFPISQRSQLPSEPPGRRLSQVQFPRKAMHDKVQFRRCSDNTDRGVGKQGEGSFKEECAIHRLS